MPTEDSLHPGGGTSGSDRFFSRDLVMQGNDLYFVIPTYRLRDVGETVEFYDEHFWRNGHSVRMIVFDDSSPANQEKYYPLLEQTRTHQEVFYVGPREKEQFVAYVNHRLRDRRLEALVKNLFRPSYGGNRNYTLMYTLGGLMVSADDDMRPYALMETSPESLDEDEVSRGRLHRAGQNGYTRQIVRHPLRVPRRARQARRRGAGQLRTRRAAGRHGDGPGDQRHQGGRARELAGAPARRGRGRRRGQDGPDVPLRDQRHRRHRLRELVPRRRGSDRSRRAQRTVRAGQLPSRRSPRRTGGWIAAWPATTTPSACRRSSPPACASRTTSIACGSSRKASSPRTSMRRRTTPRATTCATRRRRDLQRGGVQSAQAEDQGERHLAEPAEHRLRLRGRSDRPGRAGDPRQDLRAVRQSAGSRRAGEQPRSGRSRCGSSPPI